jgi:hypothetical protein
MLDKPVQVLLKSVARHLIFGISREEDRIPLEMAPHAPDRRRGDDFFAHVVKRCHAPIRPNVEVAREAELIRTLPIRHDLALEGATSWVTRFRRDPEGWRAE